MALITKPHLKFNSALYWIKCYQVRDKHSHDFQCNKRTSFS